MVDQHPAVRRRPRRKEPSTKDVRPRQTFGAPTLLVITDDPTFPELHVSEDTDVWLWGRDTGDADFSGDPGSPGTYARFSDLRNVSCVIALADAQECTRASDAIAHELPSAAVLADCNGAVNPPAGGITRALDARAALVAGLEQELVRLDASKRVRALRDFAEHADILPILVHPDPDPDALASAMGLRQLLRRAAPDTPIVTLDVITRPENRRMAELLEMQVVEITRAELLHFAHIICVDMQPTGLHDDTEVAVIDHHPFEPACSADYMDIRPRYGATATIITEYLRADDERRINERLASALTYAIKSDTEGLTRGVSPADVEAYAFLLGRADAALMRLIERPAYSETTARAFGRALAGITLCDDLAVAYLGKIAAEESHILADVADFALAIEEATWAVAGAVVEGRLVITLRSISGDPPAGEVARRLAGPRGAGGGHRTMARSVVRLDEEWGALKDAPLDAGKQLLLERVQAELAALR